MRIGIDARMYGKGFGLARYIEQLIHHLAFIPSSYTFVFFVSSSERARLEKHMSRYNTAVEYIEVDIPWYSWKEQIYFPRVLRSASLDLVHFPHWNVPLFYRKKFIVTVHDLIMYHYPRPEATTLGPVLFWIKDRIHRLVLRHAVMHAEKICVTSEFTKQDMHTTLGVAKDKMVVTYQAPFPQSTIKKVADDVLQTYGITKPYVLYVGAAYPHKNIARLVDVWNDYVDVYGDDMQLVLVGKENYFYTQIVQKIAGNPHIVYTGFVSDEDLEVLYMKSRAYVFISFYEGFGLPPLEALMHNVPVIASHTSCLPEVLGEAALYVDPENNEQIREALHTVITDEHIRHELKEYGKEVREQYSWNRLATQTYRIYETLLS